MYDTSYSSPGALNDPASDLAVTVVARVKVVLISAPMLGSGISRDGVGGSSCRAHRGPVYGDTPLAEGWRWVRRGGVEHIWAGGVVLMGAIPWAFLPLVRRLGVGPGLILGTGGLEASQGVCPLTCEAEVWGAPGLHTRGVRTRVGW